MFDIGSGKTCLEKRNIKKEKEIAWSDIPYRITQIMLRFLATQSRVKRIPLSTRLDECNVARE